MSLNSCMTAFNKDVKGEFFERFLQNGKFSRQGTGLI